MADTDILHADRHRSAGDGVRAGRRCSRGEDPRHGDILFVDPNFSLEEVFVGALWRGAQDVAGMTPHFVLAD